MRVFICTLFGAGFLASCVSPKQLIYFQSSGSKPDSAVVKPYIGVIQPNDVLSIQVSSINPEAAQFFNPYATLQPNGLPSATNVNAPLPAATGYQVAADSSVTLPLLGRVVVGGRTNSQAAGLIREKLKPYLKEATVNVRNLNFHVTVLGEVTRPSLLNIPNERITLPEALGLAGDLTIYGRRQNVMVIREENGRLTYNHLDLTQRNIFQSPYYYLHSNDVVYVEPGKSRTAAADRFYQVMPVVLSALTLIALIVTRI
ncbi:polysaccharide biosynthesis/export family protein [Spirosoma sp. KNUC1025]|uniref:polysaccharide biosynthesis/export family protein n=1 Tax=Spirosoma sp. KNUC1025 TaxID=2894082 RepID=UPI0038681ACE|nr:polysaccharide biosynthesis/export family protein [Spirosoma sp. KNUC1025]